MNVVEFLKDNDELPSILHCYVRYSSQPVAGSV